jgi:uncharacterized protein
MAARDKAITGAPCWVDLLTSDPERSRKFYAEVLGWGAEEPNAEFGGYWNFTHKGGRIAGGMQRQPEHGETPDAWSIYIAVDDAKQSVDAAAAAGAQVLAPAMDVADLGTMAIVIDPTGAAVGMWQPGTHQGSAFIGEHGAPGWFELHTRQHAAAVDFYRTAFGWNIVPISDTDEFRYYVLEMGGEQYAGLMDDTGHDVPADVPSHWLVYFAVDDSDAAVERITANGGTVFMPPEDTPYGRLAHVADSTGARFSLLGPNKDDAPVAS